MTTTLLIGSSTLKVRGRIISQVKRFLGSFYASQSIFPPQTIQVRLLHSELLSRVVYGGLTRRPVLGAGHP